MQLGLTQKINNFLGHLWSRNSRDYTVTVRDLGIETTNKNVDRLDQAVVYSDRRRSVLRQIAQTYT